MTDTEQIADLSERLKQAEAERSNALANLSHADDKIEELQSYIRGNQLASAADIIEQRDAALAKLAEVEKERDEARKAADELSERAMAVALEKDAALSQPDDEDAPGPAGLRAANAQLRKDRQMYSALVGQLRGQLQKSLANEVSLRSVLNELLSAVDEDVGTISAISLKCKEAVEKAEALLIDEHPGTALLEELRSLREAKQPEGNL